MSLIRLGGICVSLQAMMLRLSAGKNDRLRNQATSLPQGVCQKRNISYGPFRKSSLLDVYYPEGTTTPLPTIVSVHGGGYVYGNKEIYRYYCMDLARRGFTVVNINYRLAPRWKFPTPLEDINQARHYCDLTKQDVTYLRIDYKVSGVGAYSLLDKYKLLEKEISFRFSMRPFTE